CALKHLQTQKPKKNQKLHHNKPHTHTPEEMQQRPSQTGRPPHVRLDARNHYPQIKHHTPPPRWSDNQASHPTQGPEKNGPVASGPNSVSGSTTNPNPRK